MLQRHKIPTIFSIYMLDVICCALGCVVLLWQVAHQEAEEQTAQAKESHAEAVKQADAAVRARLQYEKAQADLLSASNDVTTLQATLASAQKERDRLQADLAASAQATKKASAELADAKKSNAELRARIAAADKNAQQQATALAASEESIRKLTGQVEDAKSKQTATKLQLQVREEELERARKELADITAARDKLVKEMAGDAKNLTNAKGELAALAAERDRLKEKLIGANRSLDALQAEKDALGRRVAVLQAEAEQRFAGIPLTGENVVFLIDISGSMVMKDENTDDPDKWPFLCDTLMQLMKSIPSMQRFQVILFSDKARYLFGNRDSWLKYDGPQTAKLTRDALLKVKVEGGTNMEDGFAEAFRYRKLKLDTVYLFSDGLPNLGAGVPANIPNPTEEQRNQFMGKFVRDKLKTDWNRPQEGLRDVRINAVGFFFESPDVGAFLWALAREHRGAFVGLR